ncbi:MAG: signal peptidase I [Acidimicrobiales bacterium]
MTDTRAEEHDALVHLEDAHAATLKALSERRSRVGSRPAGPSALRSIVEWVLVLGGALLVALLIRTFLFATFWIPSASMEPTLMGHPGRNDRVIVNKLSYRLHEVNRGDIVVFTKPESEATITEGGREVKDLIKRVIGLENETVSLRDGKVLVDGKALDEPYLEPGTQTAPCNGDVEGSAEVIEVPENSVLVMGDNRGNSKDGRCFGPVEESSIVGRAFVRIWPVSEVGSL